jgi:hypothetical protein
VIIPYTMHTEYFEQVHLLHRVSISSPTALFKMVFGKVYHAVFTHTHTHTHTVYFNFLNTKLSVSLSYGLVACFYV